MRTLDFNLEVLCEDSAGEYVEVYECFSSSDAEKIWDRIYTNPNVVSAKLLVDGIVELKYTTYGE